MAMNQVHIFRLLMEIMLLEMCCTGEKYKNLNINFYASWEQLMTIALSFKFLASKRLWTMREINNL